MRTTLDLDRDLLEQTREALGVGTFTETIERALRLTLEQTQASRGWAKLVGSGLSWDSPEAVEAYRREFGGRSS